MQTNISERYSSDPQVQEAESILRKCVHCGFCLATCPTYNILGDELDSPRGRIYQIKQVLEGQAATQDTQTHLDRCLTCRNCETTCPSGVEYGRLLDVGRHVVEQQTTRPLTQRWVRQLVKSVLPYPSRIGPLVKLGQFFRPIMPQRLAASIPISVAELVDSQASAREQSAGEQSRQMLILDGCVQPSMAPSTNRAAMRVLQRLGIELLDGRSVCCGAIHHHLNDTPEALDLVRTNIDMWWPLIEGGVEAIVITASGCGSMVKDYGHLLAADAAYAEKAVTIAAMTRDLSEVVADVAVTSPGLSQQLYGKDRIDTAQLQALVDSRRVALEEKTAATVIAESRLAGEQPFKVAFHPPCSLQHGQKLAGKVEMVLTDLGLDLVEFEDSHECCGSAGTYSIFQPKLSSTLKAKKISNLHKAGPSVIVSANIGCQMHLQSASQVPVLHWIELLDAALPVNLH